MFVCLLPGLFGLLFLIYCLLVCSLCSFCSFCSPADDHAFCHPIRRCIRARGSRPYWLERVASNREGQRFTPSRGHYSAKVTLQGAVKCPSPACLLVCLFVCLLLGSFVCFVADHTLAGSRSSRVSLSMPTAPRKGGQDGVDPGQGRDPLQLQRQPQVAAFSITSPSVSASTAASGHTGTVLGTKQGNSMSFAMEALWRETLVRRDRHRNQGRVRFRPADLGHHGQPSQAFERSRSDLNRDRWIQSPKC